MAVASLAFGHAHAHVFQMLKAYARIALFIIGLVAAMALFVFAFTAASVVVLVGLAGLALFGRPRVQWTVLRGQAFERDPSYRPRQPITIDHDPNDLAPR